MNIVVNSSKKHHQATNRHTCTLTGDDAEIKRKEIREYFHETFDLYESLFECLEGEKAYITRASSLRHPLIFYFGHTAVFFVNKLHAAKLISERLDNKLESMLAIGVDEMSWDDLDENHYDWPTSEEVKHYRNRVRLLVDDFISKTPINLPISWDDPMWIIMMGIEHERIHLETSSVLIRQLPIDLVKPHSSFPICPESGSAPFNHLLEVTEKSIRIGKEKNNRLYGWDNEYGCSIHNVDEYKASQFLVSNQEFMEFVRDGGYVDKQYWTDEGQNWLAFTKATHPEFWVLDGGQYLYRTMCEEIPMPWNWPVDVNYLEAKAFCNWKSQQTGKSIRLPTEAQWYALRDELETDLPDWGDAPGNINLQAFASACPVDRYKTICRNGSEFFDVIGNVWQWTESPIDGLPGFEVHPVYDDFSTPTFDGKHNLIKGGSFFSTGNYAIRDSRYAFRRHFFQHAGFRYIESPAPVVINTNPYETDEQVSQYLEFHFGSEYFGVENFSKKCVEICLEYARQGQTVKALDIGCAVGRASFELARVFEHVDGLDFSARFVSSAAELQSNLVKRYTIREEGELVSFKEASLQTLELAETAYKCRFMQGDACNLNSKFKGYDLVLGSNLVDRLYSPRKFLSMIHERINPSGLLVIVSPYTWLEEFTKRDEWLGGRKINGENVTSLDGLHEVLDAHFERIAEPVDVPFVIRETKRKFQHTLSQLTIWRKRDDFLKAV